MKAVITVVGTDTVGILAAVSKVCADYNVNISDVTQSVMQDTFCMVMMSDVSKCKADFTVFASALKSEGEKLGMIIHVMHEDIFNSMHRI
jgi:ACT domain-containing protein